MGTWVDMVETFNAMNLKAIGATALDQTKDAHVEANRRQMLRGDGSIDRIGKYRLVKYARAKNNMNPLAGLGSVDLKLTGSFHRAMNMKVTGEEIAITSTDSKTEKLVSKYTDQIFGLNTENKGVFIDEILEPEFQAIIERETGLKFG